MISWKFHFQNTRMDNMSNLHPIVYVQSRLYNTYPIFFGFHSLCEVKMTLRQHFAWQRTTWQPCKYVRNYSWKRAIWGWFNTDICGGITRFVICILQRNGIYIIIHENILVRISFLYINMRFTLLFQPLSPFYSSDFN